MARIVVAECKQEVSTFNPVASRYEDFRVARGAAALDYHRTVREEVGGALSVFDDADGVELVPALAASSNTSGGVLASNYTGRTNGAADGFMRATTWWPRFCSARHTSTDL